MRTPGAEVNPRVQIGRVDSKRTDITPHWCPVYGIPAPYDGVHEVNKATNRRPYHEHTCPSVERRKVPPQRNEGEEEPEPRK